MYLYDWPKNTDWPKVIDEALAGKRGYWADSLLMEAPDDLVRPHLGKWPLAGYYDGNWMKVLVAKFGLDARALALAAARSQPMTASGALLPFLDAEVALVMADWLVRLKSTRLMALAWFNRHGINAAELLIPAALGKPGKQRRAAEAALRFLATSTNIVDAARRYGPAAETAIAALVDEDPLEALPTKMPVIGVWADPHLLPQLLLRDKKSALSIEATYHVITVLALSKPDEKYAGVEVVRELCDPKSLTEFAWALFMQWRSSGMSAKDSWTVLVLGWLGDDDVVRRLAPIINAWPGEGGHQRAVAGLDVLAEIGTDTALTHLNRLSQKAKSKALKERARAKMAEVANALGLSAQQLADRLVPRLGLDADAGQVIDYGPRRFVIEFDEQLNPYLVDEDGKQRKSLPKPGLKDDPVLAPMEYQRFATLKKDVRIVAADEIRRLERAMVGRRRWTAAEFHESLAGHPLLWHVVRRLVWLGELDGVATAFRLAKDHTFADVEDNQITLPGEANVLLAHPLDLAGDLAVWSELFADYEISQPFPQLGRPVFTLSDAEATSGVLDRFLDTTVSVGNVLRLTKRGWERARAADNGWEPWLAKKIGERAVVLNLEPGLTVGDPMMDPEHRIVSLWLNDRRDGDWSPRNPLPFSELDALAASELLADLAELTNRGTKK